MNGNIYSIGMLKILNDSILNLNVLKTSILTIFIQSIHSGEQSQLKYNSLMKIFISTGILKFNEFNLKIINSKSTVPCIYHSFILITMI